MRALLARVIDLSGADFDNVTAGYVDLRGAILDDCSLRGAWLKGANLENASLKRAELQEPPGENSRGAARLLAAQLRGADLTGANLRGVDLSFTTLDDACLTDAELTDADLTHSSLVRADVSGTTFQNNRVYGVAAWDLKGTPKIERDLIIEAPASLGDKDYYYVLQEQQSRASEQPDSADLTERRPGAALMLDRIELAQLVHLLLRNEKIRDVIDTLGAKGVLILGRFSDERKRVLDTLREGLRSRGFVPMIFDFERPTQRDFTETIKTLAGLSRFIIADITNPRSSPLELQATVPDYMVPFVPIIQETEEPFAMFRDLKVKYADWVLDTLEYDSIEGLTRVLDPAIVTPALAKSAELAHRRAETPRHRHVRDY
jgi:hypothetical protein